MKDNLTNLIWTEDANCFGYTTWYRALTSCNILADGQCGLKDGSQRCDWRLPNPNIGELSSLSHFGYYNPALPNTAGTGQWREGDPFTKVQSDNYWSSTTSAFSTDSAWDVNLGIQTQQFSIQQQFDCVWCVGGP